MPGQKGRSGRRLGPVLRLTRRVDSAAPLADPTDRLTVEDAPAHFDAEQRRAWDWCVEHAPRLLLRADAALVSELVVAHSQWDEAVRRLKEEGLTTVNRFGVEVAHPLLDASHRLAGRVRLAAHELGFSPRARQALRAPPATAEPNPFDDI